ncbi:uncharacterized protein AKAME5_002427800 [Lates japonicus]|uniref:Uncharacterized protein n=1 Tax=Lates japonicus TaxID=270547 RepID=A0AAD3NI39_LATJO|nr:uncharacterized protein AKAME5_002427800 [Lates japonicus]
MKVVDTIFTDSRLLRETLRIVEEVNQNEKNLMEGFTDVGYPTAPAVVDFLRGDTDIKNLLQSCGGHYVVLNINDKQQIPELLDAVEKIRPSKESCSYTTETFARAQIEKIIQQDKHLTTLQSELKDLKTKKQRQL